MRILYFTRDYTTHDHRFTSSLAEAGHIVFYLRLEKREHQQEERPLPPGVQNVSWSGCNSHFRTRDIPKLWRGLNKVIKTVQPDLIHAGPIQNAGLIAALSRFQPLVIMSWGSDLLIDAGKNIFSKLITRFVLRQGAVFIGDCKAVQDKAVQFGVPIGDIIIFPWGINLQEYSSGEYNSHRNRLNWQESTILLSVRSWEPIYGVDILLLAFVKASTVISDLRLILLGGGTQESLLKKIIIENKLEDRVYIGGRVSQEKLPPYYLAADIYISASHSDGSSVSLMEALASGCPVIVSDILGNKEWVTPGVEGYLFPDGDIYALSRTIVKATRDKNGLARMGGNARLLAEKRADWSKNSHKLLLAYKLALSKHQRN